MDMISNLPDELLCHVGSFLSAKEAAFTTVLSKRWRNLFTIIQSLHFDDSEDNGGRFVDRLSSLQASSRIRKFTLKWWSSESAGINNCLRDHVLKRGVLYLNLWINGNERYSLPIEIFTCKTITKLSLGFRFSIDILPENVLLPSLKRLSLDSVKFYEFGGNCAFKTLLAASPVLEELFLRDVNWEHWEWSRTVSSLSLKRLTIMRKKWDAFDDSDFKSISFDTPNLVYLYYSDFVPKEYLKVNLNSLVEAKLHLCRPRENDMWNERDEDRFSPLMNLLDGFKNVEILNLYSIQTLKMFRFFHEELPVFEKLSRLSVDLISNSCWFSLKVILQNSPNLKTLTINGSLHYRGFKPRSVCYCVSEYSFLFSCPLEVLKIIKYSGTEEELIQMKYILGKLSCLELVQVVYFPLETSERKQKLESDLQELPRASSKCKFQVVIV